MYLNKSIYIFLILVLIFTTSLSFAAERRAKKSFVDEVTGLTFVFVKGGCYTMGNPEYTSKKYYADQAPHKVCVDDFYIATTEVSNYQYRLYKSFHSSGEGMRLNTLNEDVQPVVNVSYYDANGFAKWLSGQTGFTYRLPTEAEWEYAARAGTQDSHFWGNDKDKACDYANVRDRTYRDQVIKGGEYDCRDGYFVTAPIAQYKPNPWGLYDVLGNAAEWTCSKYHKNFLDFELSCVDDLHEDFRVVRGGAYDTQPGESVVSQRSYFAPDATNATLGFRLIMVP